MLIIKVQTHRPRGEEEVDGIGSATNIAAKDNVIWITNCIRYQLSGRTVPYIVSSDMRGGDCDAVKREEEAKIIVQWQGAWKNDQPSRPTRS